MLKKIAISSCVALAITAGTATADTNKNYFGGGLSMVSYEDIRSPETVDLNVLSLIIGHKFNDMFALEGRYGFSLGAESVDSVYDYYGQTVSVSGVEFELDYVINVFGKFSFMGDKPLSPYLLAGYTKGEGTTTIGSQSDSDNENGISFGLGADYCGESVCGALEYVRYLDEDTFEFSGINLNITFKY